MHSKLATMSEHYPKIWRTLTLVPVGRVISYGKLADLAGLPGRARLVSKALKAAPAENSLPWHRVINSQGKISFPTDSPLFQQQKALLQEENVPVIGNKVDKSCFWEPDLASMLFELEF